MKILKKILDFCNILDYSKRISLTNLAFIAIIIKAIATPTLDSQTTIALVTLCLNYVHKRKASNDEASRQTSQATSDKA